MKENGNNMLNLLLEVDNVKVRFIPEPKYEKD